MRLRAIALAPVIVPQALWVAARASRLPEASGSRNGTIGQGPAFSLLVLGDSSAAGVGVQNQSDALGGQLAENLSENFSVSWRVLAKSGGTVRSTLRRLDTLRPEEFDAVLIALGVNDAKNGVSLKNWVHGYNDLLDTLTEDFAAKHICISGLPPVRYFPILPAPLNRVLGERAELFDRQLVQMANERTNTTHLPLNFTLDTAKMAQDRFHPGQEIYGEWAQCAADILRCQRKRVLGKNC